MTDKQIIIDGVDVSGCPYYIDSDGSCSSHDCECVKCVHNVCLYKDYKAKEQECEELKKERDSWKYQWDKRYEMCECLSDQLDQLKFDYAELEKRHNDSFEQFNQLKAKEQECEELNKKCNIYTCGICGNKEDCNKLTKTLTDIKEVAEHCIKQDICATCDYSDKCHIEDEEMPTYDICKLILQKISECEGNDE